jgi:hypothetical protein
MDIKKYSSFFHDGSIFSINQEPDRIEIWIESSELLPEWNIDNLSLSSSNTIRGKLFLYEITNVFLDETLVETIQRKQCDLEILRFSIENNVIKFLVNTFDYTTRNVTYEDITIHANRIEWKNDPTLCFE